MRRQNTADNWNPTRRRAGTQRSCTTHRTAWTCLNREGIFGLARRENAPVPQAVSAIAPPGLRPSTVNVCLWGGATRMRSVYVLQRRTHVHPVVCETRAQRHSWGWARAVVVCVNVPRNVDALKGLPLAAAHVALGHGVAGTAFCSSGRSSGREPMQGTNSQCLTRAARAIPATWLDSMSNTAFLVASRPAGEQLCRPLGNREYRVCDAARQG